MLICMYCGAGIGAHVCPNCMVIYSQLMMAVNILDQTVITERSTVKRMKKIRNRLLKEIEEIKLFNNGVFPC